MENYTLWVVSAADYPWSRVFDEVAPALQSGFRALGYDVPIVYEQVDIRGTGIVLGGNAIPYLKIEVTHQDLIFFNLEQVGSPTGWFRPDYGYTDLLKRHRGWDFSSLNIARLEALGVKGIVHCGIGYAPELTRIAPREEDIDAVLVGSRHPRRDYVLGQLSAQGMRIHQVTEGFGEARDEWIARGKIQLNIHQTEARLFEIVRISYLLANRRFIISETGADAQAERYFSEGVVFCRLEEMAERCAYYLAHPEERARIAQRGFELMRALPQSDYLAAALLLPPPEGGRAGVGAGPLVRNVEPAPSLTLPPAGGGNKPRIFVTIASYRDPECQWTVKDLFEKATHPERISVGICWQYDPAQDAHCFETEPPFPEQVRVIQYHANDSKGANWARAQAFGLWQGEDYALVIDSHMRFEPGWDAILLAALARCGSEKALLTAWLPGYKPPDRLEPDEGRIERLRISSWGFAGDAQLINLNRFYRPAVEVEGRMEPACGGVANFIFGPAEAFAQVPFDPYIEFWGDEINQSARLWTHGWNFYQLDTRAAYHYWDTEDIKGREDYRDRLNPRHQKARRRNLHLFGIERCNDPAMLAELEKYPLGQARSLADYWRFCDIDLEKKTIGERAARGQWRLVSAPVKGKATIFAAIASYRDPECQATLRDMFAKASYPERVFAGICLQIDPAEDTACLLDPAFRREQIRVKQTHWRDSEGANWARAQAVGLWQGEDYILQIDSHMRFEPGWDVGLIAMLERCGEKAVLSTYLPNYEPPDVRTYHQGQCLRVRVRRFGAESDPQLLHISGAFVAEGSERAGLYPSPFYVANFMFAPAAALREVPIDPHIYFWGDEIDYAARLWTHGYDIYQPDQTLLFHYWVRKDTAHLQAYRDPKRPRSARSRERVRHVLGFGQAKDEKALVDIARYGLGMQRRLEDLWAFAGIDWQRRTITQDAQEGRWNMAARDKGKKLPPPAGGRAGEGARPLARNAEPAPTLTLPPAGGGNKPRIFVSIASYRDPECQWTVKDLFEKAAHPERIFVGICWQFDAQADAHCFDVPYPYPAQVRLHEVEARVSKGVCWARGLTQALWQGEEFTLQIDSHMRFEPGWDDMLIAMWEECANPKAVLTCYPPGYTPPDNYQREWIFGMAAKEFDGDGILLMQGMPAFPLNHLPPKPLPGAFVSCNMLFGPGSMIGDVPYDPHLYFFGEEISLAVRLWTAGYELFHPNKLVIYHYWDRGRRPTHFSDHQNWGAHNARAFARVRHLLGTEQSHDPDVLREIDRYGLGTVRSLAEYERYSGVNFAAKTIAAHAYKGEFLPPPAGGRAGVGASPLVPNVEPAPSLTLPPAGGGNSRIFINIASYRDPECQWTVKDLFEKAAHPERIFVGICWQFDPEEDKHCFEVTTRPEQVRILPVDWREAEGVCWARYQTQLLWEDEEYTLMIDSHMRFVPGWDELMLAELAACDSPKPVLSCSPVPYMPPDRLGKNMQPTIRRAKPFFPDGNLRCQGEYLDRSPEKPLNGAFIVANFVFSRSEILAEVPYDPYLYFDQEEITYAARLYTHGWDVFSARRQFLYHYYNDGSVPGGTVRPLHWNDLKKADTSRIAFLRDRGLKRFNHLTGHKLSNDPEVIRELGHFGFGRVRSFKQFEAYSGIDFKNKIASDRALRCQFIEGLERYRDRPITIPELDANKKPEAAARLPMLEIGDFVPLFEVQDSEHKTRSIEVYGGRPCLLFFLPASQPEYVERFFRGLHERMEKGERPDAWQIFILDGAPEQLQALKTRLGLPHSLWADPERKLARAFGLVRPGDKVTPPVGYALNRNLKITARHGNLDGAQLAAAVLADGMRDAAKFQHKNREQRAISEVPPMLIVPDAFTPELIGKCLHAFHQGRKFEGTVGAEDKLGYKPDAKRRTDHIVQGPLLDEIDDKLSRSLFPEIKKIFGFEVTHRELYKVGVYSGEKGGFFKQHRDNFDNPLGYRRVAMTLHLSDDYEGGGLRFPEYDEQIYRPALGSAIAFSCAMLHEARPVTRGERFVLVGFFHGEEEETYRRHYLTGRGEKLKIKDYTPALRHYPEVRQSRDFYREWQQANDEQRPDNAVQAFKPSSVNLPGNHRAKKVFESKQAIIFDDFLPEETYKKVNDFALQADYEYINTKGKVARAWHIQDGFPLRSEMNLFYHAEGSPHKPVADYVYPTKTGFDPFFQQMLAAQPYVSHLTGREGADWEHFSVTSWIYPHGTGLSLHDDGSGIYTGAYVYFLNPTWRAHWGGLLLLADEEGNRLVHEHRAKRDQIEFYKQNWLHANALDELLMEHGFAKCIFPRRNRIVFIANDAYHMVTRVNEQAGDNLRMSLAGFFNRGKK